MLKPFESCPRLRDYVQSLICLVSKPPKPLRSHPKPGSSLFYGLPRLKARFRSLPRLSSPSEAVFSGFRGFPRWFRSFSKPLRGRVLHKSPSKRYARSLHLRPSEADSLGFEAFGSLSEAGVLRKSPYERHSRSLHSKPPRPDSLGFEAFRGFSRPLRGRCFTQIPLKRTHPRPQGTRIYIILIKGSPNCHHLARVSPPSEPPT